MPHRKQGNQLKNQDIDQAGERGGDTGPSSTKGDGPQAEKGDWRRDKPVHSGKTRPHAGENNNRSGSESNAS